MQAVRICNDSDFGQAACLRFDSESNRIDNRPEAIRGLSSATAPGVEKDRLLNHFEVMLGSHGILSASPAIDTTRIERHCWLRHRVLLEFSAHPNTAVIIGSTNGETGGQIHAKGTKVVFGRARGVWARICFDVAQALSL
jgi:hypothetical protein